MAKNATPRSTLRADFIFFGLFALAKLMLHVMANGRYGIFRDEYYYMACADHLAFGYVDHPPLSILILHVSQLVLGDSLLALRLPAILASCAVIFVVGATTRRLGGARFAQGIACLATLLCPLLLAIGGFYSMNAFDHLIWAVAIYVLVRLIQEEDGRWWLVFGLVAGLGLMNKLSLLFFGGALVAAMIFTRERRWFRDYRLYLGGVIALFIFSPNIVWQMINGFPTLEFMRNASEFKNMPLSPLRFVLEVMLEGNPVFVPLWIAGCVFGFVAHGGRYRLLSLMFVFLLLMMAFTNSKVYYFAPAFLLAFPLGGIWIERFGTNRILVRPAVLQVLVCGGLVTVPFAIPILTAQQFLEYQDVLRLAPVAGEKGHVNAPMPQHFSDRFGWNVLAGVMQDAYAALPEKDKQKCVILTANYGEAGALEYFARDHEMPPVICGHNNYYLWGPGNATGEVMLVVGFDRQELEKWFGSVEEVGRTPHAFSMPYENDNIVYLCRDAKISIQEAWPKLKMFI